MKDFTMIPNRLLDSPNGLAPAEKAVLFCIYRMTMGYTQRRSCKISQSTLKIMSGVAGIGRVCGLLVDKGEIKMDDVAGKSHIFTIPEPGTSFNELVTKPPTSVTTTPNMSSSPLEHEVVGSRGAIYNIKDNFKESTLSNELIEEIERVSVSTLSLLLFCLVILTSTLLGGEVSRKVLVFFSFI